MRTIDMLALMGVVIAIFGIVVLLMSPTERRSRKSKGMFGRRKEDAPKKDWEATALRLEKHIHELRDEIAAGQNQRKALEREIMVQQQKYRKAREKLEQERGWQQKDKEDQDKKGKQVKELKTHLSSVEGQLAVEHGERLKLEKELQEVHFEFEQSRKKVASLENELHSFRKQSQEHRQEMLHLKEENIRLKKEQDDTTWVAKSDYVKLEKELKTVKKELDDLKRKKYSSAEGMGG